MKLRTEPWPKGQTWLRTPARPKKPELSAQLHPKYQSLIRERLGWFPKTVFVAQVLDCASCAVHPREGWELG